MKSLGSTLVAILVAIVALWLVFKLLVGALKLVGLLIVGALAVGAYFGARRLLEGPRDAR